LTPTTPTKPTTRVAPSDVGVYAQGYRDGWKDHEEKQKEDNPYAVQILPAGGYMFKTPDVTPAQIVAIVGAAIAVAAAFGFDLNADQRDSVLQLVTVLSSVLVVGDAAVRHGRATGNAKKNGVE